MQQGRDAADCLVLGKAQQLEDLAGNGSNAVVDRFSMLLWMNGHTARIRSQWE